MARYTGPKIKQCRREGMNLFFLGQNTSSGKVAVLQRRDYPPGVHAQSRRKVTEYGVRLREKQKLKRAFGVLERQFKRYFTEAERMKGNTGENLLSLLGRRMDSVVLAGGFATTPAQARQMVNHGHFRVNGKRMTIPSYRVRVGDVITPRDKENTKKIVSGFIDVNKGASSPTGWASTVTPWRSPSNSLPRREDFQFPIQEQLIVELLLARSDPAPGAARDLVAPRRDLPFFQLPLSARPTQRARPGTESAVPTDVTDPPRTRLAPPEGATPHPDPSRGRVRPMRIRWRNFELPSRVEADESTLTDRYGRFLIDPFERGFGQTTSNGLRRVLLSSIEGCAVTSVRIDGASHEFDSLEGVYEDVAAIILNLKRLRIDYDGDEPIVCRVQKSSEGAVTGADVHCEGTAKVVNEDLHICTLTMDRELDIEPQRGPRPRLRPGRGEQARRPGARHHPGGIQLLAGRARPLRHRGHPRRQVHELRPPDPRGPGPTAPSRPSWR